MSKPRGYFDAQVPTQDTRMAAWNDAIPSTVLMSVDDNGTTFEAMGSPFFTGVGIIREWAVPLLGAGSGLQPVRSGGGNYAY